MKSILLRHRLYVGSVMAVIAIAVAVVYMFVLPAEAEGVHPLVQSILRYGHSLCWVLLAVAAGLFATKAPLRAVMWCAYAALFAYGVFIVTYLFVKII